MYTPGQIVTLEIIESTLGGYRLDLEEDIEMEVEKERDPESDEEPEMEMKTVRKTVFLPFEDLKNIVKVGQRIEVFLYQNERHEMEATTMLPKTAIGRFGGFLPKTITDIGAFFDIGTKRDVLVPKREMSEEVERGRPYLLTLRWDALRNRLGGSTRIYSFLERDNIELNHQQEVEVIFYDRIEAGWKLVVDGKYPGLLLKQDTHQRFRIGDIAQAYVKKIEETGALVMLQKEGISNLLESKEKVLNYVKSNGGYARLGDQSDPEEIKLRLKMSKKSFKSAIGMLAKEGVLVITKRGIKLAK